MKKIAAGIVTYNPDIFRLEKNLGAIASQTSTVYCFDNGSVNLVKIRETVNKFDNVILIENGKNSGIAEGLNKILDVARKNGTAWLLTLDQDSICPSDMISKMMEYSALPGIAAICPRIIDRRRPEETTPTEKIEYTEFCITSGCLVNIQITKQIGDFDPWLFIGQVDDEYSHRIIINGYKILRINTLILDHELGNITPSKFKDFYLSIGKRLNSQKIKALSYKREVSPTRVFYSTRNLIYLSRKYCNYPNKKFTKKKAITNAVSNILRGQRKIKILMAAVNGYREGITIPIIAYEKESK